MTKTIAEMIEHILMTEGGYVNDPNDKGGPTNFGITLETLENWRRRTDLTAVDVKNLTVDEARLILTQKYVIGPGLNRIEDESLRLLVVDMFINHGDTRATGLIQTALRLVGDGILGPKTLSALNGVEQDRIYDAVLSERIRFYGRIITRDPSQSRFAAGWFDRAADFLSPN